MHQRGWSELWEGGIEVDNPDLAAKINSTLYYMLSSLDKSSAWPTGPGGVATNGYWGNAFWDNDMWSMLSVLPWWPELSKTGISYRFDRKENAAAYAKAHKFEGLYYPWQTASTGDSVDLATFANVLEKHTGADLAILLRQYWDTTHESSDEIDELAAGICEFYMSISTFKDDQFSINKVVPPDEFAFGAYYEGVDNSVYTNAAAAKSCEFAARISKSLGTH